MSTPRSILDIAPGYQKNLFKFGRGTVSTTRSIIWDGANGAYAGFFSTAVQLEAVSDSADDDAAAGAGARTLVVIGQDIDGNELTDTVDLDGTTPVDLNELFSIVYRAYVSTSGDGSEITGPNHGTIDIREKATPANIAAKILPAMGKTLMCIYRVPVNKFGKVKQLNGYPSGIANVRTTITMFTRNLFGLGVDVGEAWNIQGSGEFGNQSGQGKVELANAPRLLGPRTDVIVCGDVNTGTGTVSANFTIELEEL